MIMVRYADDMVFGFEHEADAKRFREALGQRLEKFGLSLHPDKTRLIEFGRFASERCEKRGLGKPETFNFLGFTFICGKSRNGKFQVIRKSRSDRMKAKLKEIRSTLMAKRHALIPLMGQWLGQVLRGYYGYHAVPLNMRALNTFRYHITRHWHDALRRRSQKDKTTWARMIKLAADYLPLPKILHPLPNFDALLATHPR
jgi:RNA-directed DNA polymerase